MKVEITNKQEAFKPIELTITIETEEEYKILNLIVGLNISIPKEVVIWDKTIKEHSVSDFLDSIREKINQYKNK